MLETERETFTVRLAAPADASALAEAIGQIDEETEFLGPPGEFRAKWAPGLAERLGAFAQNGAGVYLLALRGEEIVGFLGAFAGAVERIRGVVYIAHVGIRRAWRGRGVGTKLFVAIEDWARGQGAWRLDLRVDEENARGLALYRKRGFASEGRIRDGANLDGAWRNHFLMAKVLRPFAEPSWPATDVPPLRDRAAIATPILRTPQVEDAGKFRRFELKLLSETPLLLKQTHEVQDEAAIAQQLADGP